MATSWSPPLREISKILDKLHIDKDGKQRNFSARVIRQARRCLAFTIMHSYWYNSEPAAHEPLENVVSDTIETAAYEAARGNERLDLGMLMTHPLHRSLGFLLPTGEANLIGCLPAYELFAEQKTEAGLAPPPPPMPPVVEGTGIRGMGQPEPIASRTQPRFHDSVLATGNITFVGQEPIEPYFHNHITGSPHSRPASRLNHLVLGTNLQTYKRRVPAPVMAPCLSPRMVMPMAALYYGQGHVFVGSSPSQHFRKDKDMRPVTQIMNNLELANETEAMEGMVTPPKPYYKPEGLDWQQGVQLAEGAAKDKQPVPGAGVIITPPYTPEKGVVGVAGPLQIGCGGPAGDLLSPSQLAKDLEIMRLKQRLERLARDGKPKLFPGYTSPSARKTQRQCAILSLRGACSKPAEDVSNGKTEPRGIPGLDRQADRVGVAEDDLFSLNQLAKDTEILGLSLRQEKCVRQGEEHGVPVCISPQIEGAFPRRIIPALACASTLPMGHASKEKGKQRAIPSCGTVSSQPAEEVCKENSDRQVILGLGTASLSSRHCFMGKKTRQAIPSLGGASSLPAGNSFDEMKESQQAHPDFGCATVPLIESALGRNQEKQPQVQRRTNLGLARVVSKPIKIGGVSDSGGTRLGISIAGESAHPERSYVGYISPHTRSTQLVQHHLGERKELMDEYPRKTRRGKPGKKPQNKAKEVDNESKQAQRAIPGLGGAARQPAGAADGWKMRKQAAADSKTPDTPPEKTHGDKQKQRDKLVSKRDLQKGEPTHKVKKNGCMYCSKLGGTYWCDPGIGLGNRSYMRALLEPLQSHSYSRLQSRADKDMLSRMISHIAHNPSTSFGRIWKSNILNTGCQPWFEIVSGPYIYHLHWEVLPQYLLYAPAPLWWFVDQAWNWGWILDHWKGVDAAEELFA